MSTERNEERHYDDREIRLRPIVLFVIGTVLFTTATIFAMRFLFERLEAREAARTEAVPTYEAERIIPEQPLLLANPKETLLAQRAVEKELLTTYMRLPNDEKAFRIPIDRAKELILEKGLPSREK